MKNKIERKCDNCDINIIRQVPTWKLSPDEWTVYSYCKDCASIIVVLRKQLKIKIRWTPECNKNFSSPV